MKKVEEAAGGIWRGGISKVGPQTTTTREEKEAETQVGLPMHRGSLGRPNRQKR